MRQHKNAVLTIAQRIEIKRLYQLENKAVTRLALTYLVSEANIGKWIKRESPFDLPSTPHQLTTKRTLYLGVLRIPLLFRPVASTISTH
jgi:hypothetical protein